MSDSIHPSPSSWLRRSLHTDPHTCLSVVGCLSSSQAIQTQIGRGQTKASVVYLFCALILCYG
uniref:Uncharacterized protein n=1 Tax=Mesocestoides corti TaxID=53468 RepID=A0A5K3FPK2_MESCO